MEIQNSPATGWHIISHPLCPFAQRVALLLRSKGKKRGDDFLVSYVDLGNLPQSFLSLSPKKRMPVFLHQGKVVGFDTASICESIDEMFPAPFMPLQPFQRLAVREHIALAGSILNQLRGVFTAREAAPCEAAIHDVFNSLQESESGWQTGALRAAPEFKLVDIAFTPLFSLFCFYPYLRDHQRWSTLPKTDAWARRLLDDPAVPDSRCPNYGEEFLRFFALFDSHFKKVTSPP